MQYNKSISEIMLKPFTTLVDDILKNQVKHIFGSDYLKKI